MDYAIHSEIGLKLDSSLVSPAGSSTLAAYSDAALSFAFWSGVAAVALAMIMLLMIAALRARLLRRRRHDREVVDRWQPVLAQCVEGVPQDLPPLRLAERETFLRLWNHYFESLRGAAGAHLVALAVRLGMDSYADTLLARGSMRDRLLAVLTLGHLRDGTQQRRLRELASHPASLLALAAARACLEIDADEALPWLIPMIAEREDWPLSRVSTMLAEAGADRITGPLAAAFERAAGGPEPAARVARLQRLMEVAHAGPMMPAVRRVLSQAADEQVIASCLNALADPADVDAVREYCAHPGWPVRMAAARALGRLGTPGERGRLVEMLGDRHWWVRYHAAHALAGLPFVGRAELADIRAALRDRYAADMLGQVIAERP